MIKNDHITFLLFNDNAKISLQFIAISVLL